MKLSLCMIVRDSSSTLRPCLSSIRPWVDEMIVIDTGSVDDTPRIARELGARIGRFPWCDDFSAARNESLRHARGEWIFWMDSDDTIDAENGSKLRLLADGPHPPEVMAYVAQVRCPGQEEGMTVVDHVKLFRNHVGLQFEFRIHEQLLPSIRRLGGDVAWSDIFVVHSGSDNSPQGRARKHERDLRILRKELAERPDHPFALFNVGMTYADMERHGDAVEALRRCLAVSHDDESHVRKAYALLAASLAVLKSSEEAIESCEAGLRRYPQDVELHFRRAMLAHDQGDLRRAAVEYQMAISGRNGPREFSSIDPGIGGYKARHNLALVQQEASRPDLAEIQWREALRLQPTHVPSRRALADLLIRQQRPVAAEAEIERLGSARCPAAAALRVKLLLCRGEIAAARDALQAAGREFGDDDEDLLDAKCQLLFEHGEAEEARQALQKQVRRQPDNAAARHNLGAALARSGRFAEAAASFEASLELRPGSAQTLFELQEARKQAGAAVPSTAAGPLAVEGAT